MAKGAPRKTSSASRPKATKKKSSVNVRGSIWTFPKNTLEDAIRVAQALEEKNGGNPLPSSDVAKATGFNTPQDWRFLNLLRSANLYGIVTGSGANASINLTPLGQDIVAPSSPAQRSSALLTAFKKVEDFAKVETHYHGKSIPEDEFFLNTLARDFNIPRDRVTSFSDVFLKNLSYVHAFVSVPNVAESNQAGDNESLPLPPQGKLSSTSPKEPRAREFLDTCFVMMPFGTWFDRYYQDIYIPAITTAGFEPIRSDELFTTGSVVEQIWEQIEKAKVLLADLSGKNPNVFYELGLAHAAKKPVIFTASNIEDVPFDLRHLRVIVYETMAPDWAEKLRLEVSDYVRNTMKDPDKSIPHPFRKPSED